jgi:DNA polymerase III subunit alpha
MVEFFVMNAPSNVPVSQASSPLPPFVHLRLHSEYSVADGIVRIDDAVARAAKDGMPALALTDAANLFGMVKFYQEARSQGVKPIIGADCWVQNETDREKPYRLLLLCTGRDGYLRLCDLLSRPGCETNTGVARK